MRPKIDEGDLNFFLYAWYAKLGVNYYNDDQTD